MTVHPDRLVPRIRPYESTIFGEMSALATKLGAINLGQGFPDSDGPAELKAIAISAIADGAGNQYPPAHGSPDLRAAIAEHQRRFYRLELNPDTDVVVATGASEAIAATLIALIDQGDEVIVFEPYFDLYAAAIAMAGGRRVAVGLQPPAPGSAGSFRLNLEALAAAITDRTRMILVNTPHNPTGMVLTPDELRAIADLAIDRDLLVLSDEAYEHLVFAPHRHVPIATLPGMAARTVTVGSGGKTFSFTGWKVGWASGPADLIAAVRVVRQHLSYVSGGPFQPAIAAGLRLPDSYFESFADDLCTKRDHLSAGLARLGFDVLATEGTYFVSTDLRSLGITDGEAFCRELPHEAGVVAIPIAALADDRGAFKPFVRWTFCKQPAVLDQALDRLAGHLPRV
ncbi:MAG: pyridoxal phosphate-dependent aminotransferase [Candidatus Nanopelagicales bacterium]